MTNDRFEKVLRNKLHDLVPDHEVPAWHEMQRRLNLSGNEAGDPIPERKPNRNFRHWMTYAASLLLIIGLGVGLYLKQPTPSDPIMAENQPETTTPNTLPGLEDAVKIEELTTVEAPNHAMLNQLFRSARNVTITSNQNNPLKLGDLNFDDIELPSDPYAAGFPNLPKGTGENADRLSPNTPDYGSDRSFDNPTGTFGFWERNKKRPRQGDWNLAVYNSTSASGQNGAVPFEASRIWSASLAEANFTRNAAELAGVNLSHKFPVSVGISVRKNITERIALESGIVYSYLESTGNLEAEFDYRVKQQLHYLGIPLNVSYSFFNNKRWDVYAIGGFMAEFALSTSRTTKLYYANEMVERLDETPGASGVLWSTNLGAGISFDFVDNFGMYLEPGASYYFSNSKQPESYRTANPWSFNLRVGFRVKF